MGHSPRLDRADGTAISAPDGPISSHHSPAYANAQLVISLTLAAAQRFRLLPEALGSSEADDDQLTFEAGE